MRVLLTGATGYLGARVLGRLLEAGHDVSVLALANTVSALPTHECLQVFVGGLDEHDVLARAAVAREVVIHAAALLPGSAPDAIARVNVDGTENLLLAATSARVRRFVLLSSTAVYADVPVRSWPIREDYPLDPHAPGSIAYGRSKIAAEAHVKRFNERHRIDAVVLRPPPIYGPGARGAGEIVRGLLGRPLAACAIAAPGVPMQWVHVDDLAAAVGRAAFGPALTHEICNVAGGELFDLRALSRVVAGVRTPAGRIGQALLHAAALPALPLRYDLGAAARVLGWRPAIRLVDGIAEMVREELAGAMRTPPSAGWALGRGAGRR